MSPGVTRRHFRRRGTGGNGQVNGGAGSDQRAARRILAGDDAGRNGVAGGQADGANLKAIGLKGGFGAGQGLADDIGYWDWSFARRHHEANGGADGGLETSGRILADNATGGDGLAGLEDHVTDSQALSRAGHAGIFDLNLGIQLSLADHVRNRQQRRTRGHDKVDGGAGGGLKTSDGILTNNVALGNGGTGALRNGSNG